MSPVVGVAVALALIAGYALWVSRPAFRRSDADLARERFDNAVAAAGPVNAGLMRIARPVVATRAAADLSRSPVLNGVQNKVVASGLYSGSVEVYVAYQTAALLVAAVLLVAGLAVRDDALVRILLVVGGLAVAAWPYDRVNRAAKAAAEEAAEALPEFVELLLIPLTSGMSVEASLAFTARQTSGVVSDSVQWLLETLASRTMSESDAYAAAGRRIGSSEALAFFNSLYQAQVQGVQITEPLRRQADSLRVKHHQERRAKVKRIPVKLIVAFAVHFLPLLFILVLVPLMFSLAQL